MTVFSGMTDCRGGAVITMSNRKKYMHATKKCMETDYGSKCGISVNTINPWRRKVQINKNGFIKCERLTKKWEKWALFSWPQVGFSNSSESAPQSFHMKYICLCESICALLAHTQISLCLGQPVFPEAWNHSPLSAASTHNWLDWYCHCT